MDKTLISGMEAAEDKEGENDNSKKEQPDEVKTEQTTRDLLSQTAKPDEADEKLTERLQPASIPEDQNRLCAVCGFSAKCPRSLKIHYARRHGSNSKNGRKTAKPSDKCENISDTSSTEIQREAHMETGGAAEIIQNQPPDLDELKSASGDNSTDKKSLEKKESVSDKQQMAQEEAIQTQERRLSKRTPKPKIIHSCNYCGQEFWGKSPLDLHIQRYHAKDTPYTCKYISEVKVETQLHISCYSIDVIKFNFKEKCFMKVWTILE